MVGKWFVYRILIDGQLAYIGKGCGKRHLISAKRLGGIAEIVRHYRREWAALRLEKKLIAELRPPCNKTKGGEGKSKRSRQLSDAAIERGWMREAYAKEHSGFWLDALIAQCFRKCEENDLRNKASV